MKRLSDKADVRTENGLRKLVLLAWTDSNMYDQWTWEVFLTQRSDGSISTGARQFGVGIPSGRIQGTYRIRSGRALKAAVEELFASDVFQDVDWDWPSLLVKIDQFTPSLAESVRKQIRLEEDEEHRQDEAYDQLEASAAPVREWVNRANWQHSNTTGAGGIARQVANLRLDAGVTAYVNAHLNEHGRYPTGTHDIDQAIGDVTRAAECEVRRDGIGRAVVAPGRVKLSVQFPKE